MPKGTVLITGSSGFIGSHVVAEAIKNGYKVKGLDIADPKQNGGFEFVRADIRDKKAVSDAMEGVDYVVHLAAITSVVEFEKDPVTCFDININGFLNVLSAALKNNVKKVVYASSSAVYTGKHFSEELPIDYMKQNNPYSQSKLINEMHAQYFMHSKGLKCIGLRFFNVFGEGENEKGQYASIVTQFMKNKANGEPLIVYGDGLQARDFIYVDDVAKITLLLLKKADSGVYNVGTGQAISYKRIAEIIDKDHIKYVENPLKSYQYLTKADTSKLLMVIGRYEFVKLEEWMQRNAIRSSASKP
ncbi:MAG: NAD-dependent epimerase/dehydratase family protein [Candidatus Micrarchaeaceae archaeon]